MNIHLNLDFILVVKEQGHSGFTKYVYVLLEQNILKG